MATAASSNGGGPPGQAANGGGNTDEAPLSANRATTVGSPRTPLHSPNVGDKSARSIRERLRALERTLSEADNGAMAGSPDMDTHRRHIVRMVTELRDHERRAAERKDQGRISVLNRAEQNLKDRERIVEQKLAAKEQRAHEALKERDRAQKEYMQEHSQKWLNACQQARQRIMNGMGEHRKKMEESIEQRGVRQQQWEKKKCEDALRARQDAQHKREAHEARMERLREENERQERKRDEEDRVRSDKQRERRQEALREKMANAERAKQKRQKFAQQHAVNTDYETLCNKLDKQIADQRSRAIEKEKERQEIMKEKLDEHKRMKQRQEENQSKLLDEMFTNYEALQVTRSQREQKLEESKKAKEKERVEKSAKYRQKLMDHREVFLKNEEIRLEELRQKNAKRHMDHAKGFSRGAEQHLGFLKSNASPPPAAVPAPPPINAATAGTGKGSRPAQAQPAR